MPISETWSGAINASISMGYNNDMQRVSRSINGANTVSYSFDNDGMLSAAGSMTVTRNTQNGALTGTALGSVTTSYASDQYGDMSAFSAAKSGAAFMSVTFTRDALSRITRQVEAVLGIATTYDYQYDTAGRLVGISKNGVATSSYAYDSNGNRISATVNGATTQGVYDQQDRLVTYGSNSYTYTPSGDLLSKTANGLTTTYNYDAMGNLLSATMSDGTVIEYIIDGRNRRIGKKVNGVLTQGLIYSDPLSAVAELDGNGNVVSSFVYGINLNAPDYIVKGGVTYKVITDHLSSPKLIVNTADGSIAQQMDYDEWGNVIRDTNPGFQPFGFAGGIYDQHTKLARFGARDYDAETGRWTAKDPIEFAGSDTNLYGYSNQDPVNYIDPSGLCAYRLVYMTEYKTEIKNGKLRYCSKGILCLLKCSTIVKCWMAVSGCADKGTLPPGEYDVGSEQETSNPRMCRDGSCYKYPITPPFGKDAQDRTYLRIHPDGGKDGTAGCIGVQSNPAGFKNEMTKAGKISGLTVIYYP